MTSDKSLISIKIITLLTVIFVGIFLYLCFLRIPVFATRKRHRIEEEKSTLIRTGSESEPQNILAILLLFVTLSGIGIHAYTTKIYPSK